MLYGVDYVAGPSTAALKKAGARFVCRYVSTPGNPKNLTAAEAARLRNAGIDIVVVFETTATRALAGETAGRRDALSARRQVTGCGLPADTPIYMSVDFDVQAGEVKTVLAYLHGAAAALGYDHAGVYGGYRIVKAALEGKVVRYGWQTRAWSGGRWHPDACLQQYAGNTIGGCQVDENRATKPDFGQWPRPKPPRPKPAPAPKPAPKPSPAPKPAPGPVPAPAPADAPVAATGPHGGRIATRPLGKLIALLPGLLKRFGRITLTRKP